MQGPVTRRPLPPARQPQGPTRAITPAPIVPSEAQIGPGLKAKLLDNQPGPTAAPRADSGTAEQPKDSTPQAIDQGPSDGPLPEATYIFDTTQLKLAQAYTKAAVRQYSKWEHQHLVVSLHKAHRGTTARLARFISAKPEAGYAEQFTPIAEFDLSQSDPIDPGVGMSFSASAFLQVPTNDATVIISRHGPEGEMNAATSTNKVGLGLENIGEVDALMKAWASLGLYGPTTPIGRYKPSAIKAMLETTSDGISNYAKDYVYAQTQDGTDTLVSTDGHRMTIYERLNTPAAKKKQPRTSGLIPPKMAALIAIGKDEVNAATLKPAKGEPMTRLTDGFVTLYDTPPDGAFVPWEEVIQLYSAFRVRALIGAKDLAGLGTACVKAGKGDNDKTLIAITLKSGEQKLACDNNRNQGRWESIGDLKGPPTFLMEAENPLKIGFDARYVEGLAKQAIAMVGNQDIKLSFIAPNKPMRAEAGTLDEFTGRYTHVLMPISLALN